MTMLDLLKTDQVIINIDESWLNETNYTRMMWCPPSGQGTITSKQVTPRIALIAALDTNGRVYYSMSQANTDTDVLMLFMRYLIKQLDSESADWRNETIFLLDGAKYHVSEEMREYFRKMDVQVIYSGPYSFSTAPIELLFGALKRGNLNPEK